MADGHSFGDAPKTELSRLNHRQWFEEFQLYFEAKGVSYILRQDKHSYCSVYGSLASDNSTPSTEKNAADAAEQLAERISSLNLEGKKLGLSSLNSEKVI